MHRRQMIMRRNMKTKTMSALERVRRRKAKDSPEYRERPSRLAIGGLGTAPTCFRRVRYGSADFSSDWLLSRKSLISLVGAQGLEPWTR
jgi:hypothetical protein